MNKEVQDKYWAELSKEDKAYYKEQYAEQKTMSESGVPKLLEQLFGSHNLNPKTLTYEDVAKELFGGRVSFHTEIEGKSHEHLSKMLAINKLLNVAKYLNGDWKPDWKNEKENKWYIEDLDNEIDTDYTINCNSRMVYFRTQELAKQAIQILGEETIRLALTTDY